MANSVDPNRTTRQISRGDWKSYFDRFTKRHLTGDPPKAVTIEVLSPTLGDQFEARPPQRLIGLAYDPKSDAFEVLLEDVDHLVFQPEEIWVVETEGDFISTLELVRADGTKEIVYVYRSGPPARRYEQPAGL